MLSKANSTFCAALLTGSAGSDNLVKTISKIHAHRADAGVTTSDKKELWKKEIVKATFQKTLFGD